MRKIHLKLNWYWTQQALYALTLAWFAMATLANMYVGDPLSMLWSLVMVMLEAIFITHAWERRHAN